MTKFNTPSRGSQTANLAGGSAFKQSPKLELISTLVTSFVNGSFYEKADDTIDRIANIVKLTDDKLFAAKAAIYARDRFNMRSASHVVAGEIAAHARGEEWTKYFFDKVIVRPDDMLEIISYYKNKYGDKEPNALKKGFARAFQRFDEYQISKYKKSKLKISLVDLVNLVHPKPTEAITKLVKGTLKAPKTWEVKITQAGSDAEKKAKSWEELVRNGKLGYMALLRNLRNIEKHAEDVIDIACNQLTNRDKILKSRVLPFRFFSALENVTHRSIIAALSTAIEIALSNVPKLKGKMLIAVDCSASMRGKASTIASMFGSVLYKALPESEIITFDTVKKSEFANPADSIFSIAKSLDYRGGGTDFSLIFNTDKKYDRIVILSDMQPWQEQWGVISSNKALNNYKKRTGADPLVYSFDLASTGTMQFPEANVYALAGWSPEVFNIMKLLEEDKNAMINAVEAIEL